jgi:2-octaprenylphenol hydroxylase
MRDLDALIVGGGVVGATMASLLIERGLAEPKRVALVDARFAPPPAAGLEADWDLRVVALSRASQRVLEHAGAWSRLPRARVHPYQRMCVWDASAPAPRTSEGPGAPGASGAFGVFGVFGAPPGVGASAGSIRFDAADLGEPDLGSIVDARALKAACLEAAAAAGALLIEARVLRIDPGAPRGGAGAGVRVRLDDGRDLDTGLVLAADGADSPTRTLLGIDTVAHQYLEDALVAHVRTERAHEDTAWQRFLPTGPLAFLPLSDGRVSIVWSCERREAERLRLLDAAAFGAALTEASDAVLGAVEVTTPIVSFPLVMQHAQRYVAEHAVLLGDAAHAVHPLAGQGLNLGLLDCATLAEVLGEARASGRSGPVPALADAASLRRYERWRRSENLAAAAALDALQRLFSNSNPLTARVRRFGLEAVGRVPVLRNALARRALGLSGDIPAFLRSAAPLRADRASQRR